MALGHQNVQPVDNELWVSDPVHPRLLHPKRPGTVDRTYVQAMAIPPLPVDVLDEGEVLFPAPVGDLVLRSPEAPALANAATAVRGNVIVVEGTDQLVRSGQRGLSFNHNNGIFNILNQILGGFGDNFDFVTVFTTFSDNGVAAYYLPLKQDVDGLGECNQQQGKTFGCLFDQLGGQVQNLQGFVFMNSLATWQDWDRNYDGVVHPFTSFDSGVFSTLGQEVAHRWGSGLRFKDSGGRVSNLLLGRDGSHWAAYVDTDGSVMDGWDWTIDGNRFDLTGDMDIFSTLDLYTIGALPVAAAQPFFVIGNARYDIKGRDLIGINGRAIGAEDVLQLPSDGLLDSNGMNIGAVGSRIDVTIQDVVDAEGNRCPDPDATQKTFRQGVILVTQPGQTIAQAESIAQQLNTVLATWEDWWLDRTNKTLRLCTDIGADCRHAEQQITNGVIEHSGDSFEPGATATVKLTVRAKNNPVEGAVFRLRADGNAADSIELPQSVQVGAIGRDEEKVISFDVKLAADYPCGTSGIIIASLEADNAATVREELRFFPGYKTLFSESFATAEHRFSVNVDGQDGTTRGDRGALVYTPKVELTCDMSQRTPERDASPDNEGAFVTGPGTDHVPNLLDNDPGDGAELNGDTSLWSPFFNLEGARDPEIRFAYWLDGKAGDKLKVQLSRDDEKSFQTAREFEESFHGWVVGRVSVRDVYDEVPPEVSVRFIFEGGGSLEGGIDDVRVLDYDGQCLSVARGAFCGCDQSGDSTPVAPLAILVGLVGLRRLRRLRV